ncbi:hypothetical protein [Nocardia sp. NPDC004260]
MEYVTARATQTFGDWKAGEVRTIDRTPFVDALIRDERLIVVETEPDAVDAAKAAVEQAEDNLAKARADTRAAEEEMRAPLPGGRRRPPGGNG